METRRKRTSNTNCCVVGCNSTYTNDQDAKFYSFPNKKWEFERKRKWIKAVNRVDCNGKYWTPNARSRICSRHFVGGRKSEMPTNPAYYPTIFPHTPNSASKSASAQKRFERQATRWKKSKAADEPLIECDMAYDNTNFKEMTSVSCQTDFDYVSTCETTVLFCCIAGNNAGTQTNIKQMSSIAIQVGQPLPQTRDACVGDDKRDNFFHGYSSVQDDDNAMKDVAGITHAVFKGLMALVIFNPNKMILSNENMLLLFLIKMKYGLSYTFLGKLFGIHRTTAAHHFKLVLNALYSGTLKWLCWPSKFANKVTMPDCFKIHYPNCTAIIDCTEIFCERPVTVHRRVQMYSSYKSNFTMKYLIAIAPSGVVSFLSKGYGGRCTDSYITVHSGILNNIKPGDVVLADKGFPQIKSTLEDHGAVFVMPPFAKHDGTPFTEEECQETYNIASVRIHVERAIQRVKLCAILTKIPSDLVHYIDKVMHMCAILANLQPPIIKQ